MAPNNLPAVHPGEFLREEYLVPLGLSAGVLAKHLNVPRTRIERVVAEQTAMTTDTALRLAKFFGTAPEFWMNMQSGYDIKIATAQKKTEIARIKTVEAA